MLKVTKSSFNENLLLLGYITIITVAVSDIISKISRGLNFDFYRYTLIAKVGLLIIYGLFFIYNHKAYIGQQLFKKILYVILILLSLFFLTNIFPFNNSDFDYHNSEFVVRYLYYPITFLIFYQLYNDQKKTIKLFKFYEFIFLINLGLILIAFIFNLELLKSYPNPNRFGFSGIYMRTNQVSYIFLIFIAVYYYQINYLKNGKLFKFIFTLLMALLIGTKRLYFFLILLGLYHICISRKRIRTKHLIAFSAIISLGYFFRQTLLNLFQSKFNLLIKIYHEKGLISALTSYRNETLLGTLKNEVFPKWDFINYLLGGTNFTNYRPEMDLIDLFLYFGLIGVMTYVYWVKLIMKTLNFHNKFLIFFFVILLFISFLSSGFFNSVNVPFVFLLGVFYIKHISNPSHNFSKQ